MADDCQDFSACSILVDTAIHAATKEAVDDACLATDVDTIPGFLECAELCAAHLCCFQDPEEPSSCINLLGQAKCDIYSSCAFLVATENHPYLFVDDDSSLVALVEEACTEDNIATDEGRELCGSFCLKASCCYIGGPDGCQGTVSNCGIACPTLWLSLLASELLLLFLV